jgi:hypothetical protein
MIVSSLPNNGIFVILINASSCVYKTPFTLSSELYWRIENEINNSGGRLMVDDGVQYVMV